MMLLCDIAFGRVFAEQPIHFPPKARCSFDDANTPKVATPCTDT